MRNTSAMAHPLKEKLLSKATLTIVVALVIIVAVGTAVYFFLQYQKSQQLLNNPNLAAQIQEKALLDQVGKLMVLPSGEVPQVATVSDVTKLQDQPFFQNAKNGDKVLIYTKARIAILYDPIANKIINVAPVNLGNATPQAQPTLAATPTPTLLHRVTPTPTLSK